MKIKNKVTLFTMVILFIQPVFTESPSDVSSQMLNSTLKSSSMETKLTNHLELERFNASFAEYIQEQYNHNGYTDHMSQNGSDLITLLEAIREAKIGDEKLFKTYTVFKLWNDKLKGSQLVDDNVLIQILPKLPELIGGYLKIKRQTSLDEIKSTIEYQLQLKLIEHFDEFSINPESCISKIAEKLAKKYYAFVERIEDINKLKSMVTRFFEGSLNKVIWNFNNYEGIWDSVLSLSNGIKGLFNNNIIDDEDELDGLYWSLTHRFCFFLDLRGALLPVSFYETVEEDLHNGGIAFLEEEQDDFITTKQETFAKALVQAKIKAMAFHQNGIISDEL